MDPYDFMSLDSESEEDDDKKEFDKMEKIYNTVFLLKEYCKKRYLPIFNHHDTINIFMDAVKSDHQE